MNNINNNNLNIRFKYIKEKKITIIGYYKIKYNFKNNKGKI